AGSRAALRSRNFGHPRRAAESSIPGWAPARRAARSPAADRRRDREANPMARQRTHLLLLVGAMVPVRAVQLDRFATCAASPKRVCPLAPCESQLYRISTGACTPRIAKPVANTC